MSDTIDGQQHVKQMKKEKKRTQPANRKKTKQ